MSPLEVTPFVGEKLELNLERSQRRNFLLALFAFVVLMSPPLFVSIIVWILSSSTKKWVTNHLSVINDDDEGDSPHLPSVPLSLYTNAFLNIITSLSTRLDYTNDPIAFSINIGVILLCLFDKLE